MQTMKKNTDYDTTDCSIRDLLKKPVFERGDGKWFDKLPTIAKQFFNINHTSTK